MHSAYTQNREQEKAAPPKSGEFLTWLALRPPTLSSRISELSEANKVQKRYIVGAFFVHFLSLLIIPMQVASCGSGTDGASGVAAGWGPQPQPQLGGRRAQAAVS